MEEVTSAHSRLAVIEKRVYNSGKIQQKLILKQN